MCVLFHSLITEIAADKSATCSQLTVILSTHPDLQVKIAEVFALLAREGTYHISFIIIFILFNHWLPCKVIVNWFVLQSRFVQ